MAKAMAKQRAAGRPERCRRKFLRFFPDGFRDETYLAWERGYKERAHQQWTESLNRGAWRAMLGRGAHLEFARQVVAIESRTNLLFSFEKMALRDAVRDTAGARAFAEGLYDLLYGRGPEEGRFLRWIEAVSQLPRRQTRVLTWPVLTVFPFIADPEHHIFLKPTVTRRAAERYGADFDYRSVPNWNTYRSLRMFAERIRQEQRALRPRDMIDLQSFIWVQGSDEYA
jgi:hypothetical protein